MRDERIDKLPKWAQDYINGIERQRELAVRALNEYTDNQTPSPYFYDDLLCLEDGSPKNKVVYVQTYKMSVGYAGVQLDIYLRDDTIELTWWTGRGRGEVAFIPLSYQKAKLVSKENMF